MSWIFRGVATMSYLAVVRVMSRSTLRQAREQELEPSLTVYVLWMFWPLVLACGAIVAMIDTWRGK
jgi:hypothetical protein